MDRLLAEAICEALRVVCKIKDGSGWRVVQRTARVVPRRISEPSFAGQFPAVDRAVTLLDYRRHPTRQVSPGEGAARDERFFRQPDIAGIRDGHFLFSVPDEELRDRTIHVVLNWEALLRD